MKPHVNPPDSFEGLTLQGDHVAFSADNWTLDLACVEMRYQAPKCDECRALPVTGWLGLGKTHRDCGGKFRACDDRCEDITIDRTHNKNLTCDLCGETIPGRERREK